MSETKDDFYDFHDWYPGGEDIVRQNLVAAFKAAREGYWWVTTNYDEYISTDCLEWCCKLDEGHDYAPLVTIDPVRWRDAMLEELRLMALDVERNDLERCWRGMTTGWRAALDAVDAKAKELLGIGVQ